MVKLDTPGSHYVPVVPALEDTPQPAQSNKVSKIPNDPNAIPSPLSSVSEDSLVVEQTAVEKHSKKVKDALLGAEDSEVPQAEVVVDSSEASQSDDKPGKPAVSKSEKLEIPTPEPTVLPEEPQEPLFFDVVEPPSDLLSSVSEDSIVVEQAPVEKHSKKAKDVLIGTEDSAVPQAEVIVDAPELNQVNDSKPEDSKKLDKPLKLEKFTVLELGQPEVSNSDKPEEAKSKEPKVSKSEKPEASEFEQHEVIKPEETEESKSEEPKVSNSDKPEEAKSKEPQVSKSEKPEASESEQYEVIKPEETEESKSEQLEVTRQDISKKPVVFKSTQVFPSSLFFLDLKKYSLSFAQIFEVENSGTEIGVLEIKEDPLTQTVVNSLGLSQNSNKPKKPTKLEKTQQDPAVFRNAQALFALFFLDPTGSLSLPHLFTKGSSIGDSAVRPDVKGNYDDSVRSSATNFSKLSKTNEKPGKAVVSVGAKAPSSLRSFDLKNSSSSEQNVLLTDTEKMKVANLLTELCKTVPCHDQKEGKDMLSMLRNFLIHVKGKDFKSEDLKEYMQNLKDGFNHASEKSAQADGHVFVNPSFASSESGGKKLFTNNNERLSEIEKMKGQSPHGQHPATNPAWFLANVVPSSYTTPHLEFSRELAQAVVTGLRNTETFVRETIFSAKENIQQGVLHNAIKVSSSLQEKRLPVSTLKTTPGIGEEGSFITIDSVVIGKEVAAAHALMNPPKILHPFMRWLLYQKYMTPSVIKQATQTRQKVERLYAEAKAKNLKVRYNDQIHDAYLPLPDEAGGEYAIVKLVAATSK